MSVCAISGTIMTLDGQPASGQQVLFSVRSTLDDQGGQLASYTAPDTSVLSVGITSDSVTVFTDTNGGFEVDLLRGARVLMEIPGINLRKEIQVPDASEADFADLI